jgi:hypothetical protein
VKAQWLGVLGVLAVASAIVGYKSSRSAGTTRAAAPHASEPGLASVVLVADMREADSRCGCGEIIRSVRAGAAKGIPTREVDPAVSPDLAASYRVQVPPAVLFFDDTGKEIRRFEGESTESLTAIRLEIERLQTKRP